MSNIGMMEGAYFVGRGELLQWLNQFLKLSYIKIEQVCSGAAFCQLMDAIHPGKVQLSKVNFNAKLDYEYIKNYKVLQSAFDKVNLEKRIEVDKLIKGKYQDNLEFLQWFKGYFDRTYPGGDYDAVGRRNGMAHTDTHQVLTSSLSSSQKSSGRMSLTAQPPSKKPVDENQNYGRRASVKQPPATSHAPQGPQTPRLSTARSQHAVLQANPVHSRPSTANASSTRPTYTTSTTPQQKKQTPKKLQPQQQQQQQPPQPSYQSQSSFQPPQQKQETFLDESFRPIQESTFSKPSYHELELMVDGMERERDFYYQKLLQIEQIVAQQSAENPVFRRITDILYAGNGENAEDVSFAVSDASPLQEDCF